MINIRAFTCIQLSFLPTFLAICYIYVMMIGMMIGMIMNYR